jgi:hypothetical protein
MKAVPAPGKVFSPRMPRGAPIAQPGAVAAELRDSPSPESPPDRHGRRGRCARAVTVVALGAGTAAGIVAGCSSAESANASGYYPYDSGYDAGIDVGTTFEGGPPPPTALFVNAAASPTVSDVRLCWQVAGMAAPTVAPIPGSGPMPGSNYPGIPLGGAVAMSDVTPLLGGNITFYAIDAENLARLEQGASQEPTCAALICGAGANLAPPCLREGTDYWPVASLEALGLQKTSVIALTGCLATALDPSASGARCGSSWNDVQGNLHMEVTQLQPTLAVDAGQLSVQVALLSPALAGALGDSGAVVSFGAEDGGTPVATLAYEDDVEPVTGPVTLSLGTSLQVFGTEGFSVDAPGLADGHEWMSLVEAQQLVDPTQDPTVFFGQPRTYLVAVMGDPASAHAFASEDAGYDGTGLHLLVIATPAPASTEPPDAL